MRIGRLWPLAVLALLLPCCKWAYAKVAETLRYVARYDNGVTRKEGSLQDGRQVGRWTFHYEDGRKRSEGDYRDDHQVGAWTAWYENGRVEWQGSYDEKGARSGPWTFFYDDGQRRAAGRFADDMEQGRWTFWDHRGVVQRTGDFLDARMVGWWSYCGDDGKPRASGLLLDGTRVGPWQTTDAQGAAAAVDYPLPQGLQLVRETWPDGSCKRTGLMRDGKPVGGWASFHEGGGLRMTCVHADGAVRTFWCAGADGTVLAEGRLDGNELIDWTSSRDGAAPAADRTPLPPVPSGGGEWSSPSIAKAQPADEVVAVWLAEIRAPASPVAAPAPAATAAPVAADSPRLPSPRQPDWTVLESKELEATVRQYEVGSQKPPAAFARYSVPKALQGVPRRRADLEGKPLELQELRATDGTTVKLADYRGKKRVLLVVLRGFFGQVCVYCVAQTEALARSKADFEGLNLEVLIVYPGPEGNEQAFLQAYEETFEKGPPPYRVFYDPDLQMVKQLGIEGGDLAYPTTIFLDEQGIVRYAYTGAHRADRPAAQDLIKFIRSLDAK